MTEVNEEYVSGVLGVQIVSSEDSVVKSHCSRLVQQSRYIEFSNLGSIKQSLAFQLGVVRRDRDDCFGVD